MEEKKKTKDSMKNGKKLGTLLLKQLLEQMREHVERLRRGSGCDDWMYPEGEINKLLDFMKASVGKELPEVEQMLKDADYHLCLRETAQLCKVLNKLAKYCTGEKHFFSQEKCNLSELILRLKEASPTCAWDNHYKSYYYLRLLKRLDKLLEKTTGEEHATLVAEVRQRIANGNAEGEDFLKLLDELPR